MVFHGHGEFAEFTGMSLAHGYIDEDVHGSIYQVLQALGFPSLALPRFWHGSERGDPIPLVFDPTSLGKAVKRRTPAHTPAMDCVIDVDVGGLDPEYVGQQVTDFGHDRAASML